MRKLIALMCVVLLSACAAGFSDFPVTVEDQAELGDGVTIIRLDDQNVASFAHPVHASAGSNLPGPSDWTYRVGPGDILSVLVFNHPELTLPAGPARSSAESGFRVQSNGTFFYPFVGQVQAAGLPPEQIRADLRDGLAEFIADPQLEVRVASFNSQAVNITGAVDKPSRLPLTTTPLTLIDAVNLSGGLGPDADAEHITVQRSGRSYRVDLQGFLERGRQSNNPLLLSGDVVFVPQRETEDVFVLGEVGSPASIDLAGEDLSLTQALSRRGGLDELRADARGIFVFRGGSGAMTVFQLSVTSPEGYVLGTRFMLQPGDVIYVTRAPLQRWNDTISGLLPTIGAVNATSGTLDGL